MNGFRSYSNTPTDVRESPLGVGILTLNRLKPYKDAMTIGPTQRIVLDDKKDEFQRALWSKKLEFEAELLQRQRRLSLEREGSGSLPALLDEVPDVKILYYNDLLLYYYY